MCFKWMQDIRMGNVINVNGFTELLFQFSCTNNAYEHLHCFVPCSIGELHDAFSDAVIVNRVQEFGLQVSFIETEALSIMSLVRSCVGDIFYVFFSDVVWAHGPELGEGIS